METGKSWILLCLTTKVFAFKAFAAYLSDNLQLVILTGCTEEQLKPRTQVQHFEDACIRPGRRTEGRGSKWNSGELGAFKGFAKFTPNQANVQECAIARGKGGGGGGGGVMGSSPVEGSVVRTHSVILARGDSGRPLGLKS